MIKIAKHAAAAIAIIALAGCGSSDDNGSASSSFESFTPFKRVAQIDASLVPGTTSTDRAKRVAQAIAEYVHKADESATLKYKSNWVLAGANETVKTYDEAIKHILEIPYTDGSKAMVVEVCNKVYAGMAMETGKNHGPSLPCEISVYEDAKTGKIYIDVLDPVAIFTLFYTDISSAQKKALATMPGDVKNEIIGMVYAALDDASAARTNTSNLLPTYAKLNEAKGPAFSSDAEVMAAAQKQPYTIFAYSIDGTKVSTADGKALATNAAQAIINNLTVNSPTNPGITGLAGSAYSVTMSEGSAWRSARATPLPVPGNVFTVEACSPKYAKMALGMAGDSRDHTSALPCQISVYTSDDNKTLYVSYLNPVYMFEVMFADKMKLLTPAEQSSIASLPTTVYSDLKKVVDFTLDHNIPWSSSKAK